MFGVLKPSLSHVSAENQKLYHTSYCNLCASLSASGTGVLNRFFLINDIVTIDWLLTEQEKSDHHVYACNNCVKSGVIGKKRKTTSHQKLLAAMSSFISGVKIKDNVLDEPTLTSKSIAFVCKPVMKKAEATLEEFAILHQLQHWVSVNNDNESQQVSEMSKAAEPTEKFYELITLEAAKTLSTLPKTTISLLGRYMGRCVYLIDAIADMDEDQEKQQYNVLNLLSANQPMAKAKKKAIKLSLDFLKPMRLEITEKLSVLPQGLHAMAIQEKWESLFIHIESQLLKLIEPLNDQTLLHCLSSFSSNQYTMGTGLAICDTIFKYLKKIPLFSSVLNMLKKINPLLGVCCRD